MSVVIDRAQRLRLDEYERLVEAGTLQGQRVELFRGGLRPMSPIGLQHRTIVTRLYRLLDRAISPELEVQCQQPFVCVDDSEPEPDLVIVPYVATPTSHPRAALLVIEVADTSLDYDLGDKAALYAGSDVTEYWVIDVVSALVHVHQRRAGGRWTSITRHAASDRLTPGAVPGVAVVLTDLVAARR